jgi:ABC-type uncharacterized transport system fused permease/ATPase subunit
VPLLFAAVAALLTGSMLSRVARLSYNLERAEGKFRMAHARIRTYVESIAFFRGGQKEQRLCDGVCVCVCVVWPARNGLYFCWAIVCECSLL